MKTTYSHFQVGDQGHTLVIGTTMPGKTTLLDKVEKMIREQNRAKMAIEDLPPFSVSAPSNEKSQGK